MLRLLIVLGKDMELGCFLQAKSSLKRSFFRSFFAFFIISRLWIFNHFMYVKMTFLQSQTQTATLKYIIIPTKIYSLLQSLEVSLSESLEEINKSLLWHLFTYFFTWQCICNLYLWIIAFIQFKSKSFIL